MFLKFWCSCFQKRKNDTSLHRHAPQRNDSIFYKTKKCDVTKSLHHAMGLMKRYGGYLLISVQITARIFLNTVIKIIAIPATLRQQEKTAVRHKQVSLRYHRGQIFLDSSIQCHSVEKKEENGKSSKPDCIRLFLFYTPNKSVGIKSNFRRPLFYPLGPFFSISPSPK